MFETIEQYQSALNQAQDKEAFIAQYGNGEGLPSQADLDHFGTQLAPAGPSVHEALNPVGIPVESNTSQETLNEKVKPETVNETDGSVNELDMTEEAYEKLQQQKLQEEEVTASNYQQKIDLARQKGIEERAIRDVEGNMVLDMNGNPVMRDLSTFEKIQNSATGMINRIQQLAPNMEITAGEVMKRLIPEEVWDDYNENGEASLLANLGALPGAASMLSGLARKGLIPKDADVDQAIMEKLVLQAEQEAKGETGSITEGIKNGDLAEVGAGLVNAASSFLPSIIMGTATFGTSTGAEMFGDMYTSYNKTVADKKGKTIEELRADGEDSFGVPLAMAAPATALEMMGFKGASNAVLKHAGKPLAKRAAAALMAGNKEGATEFFQTGLEVANETLAATDNNVVEASTAAVDAMFSQQGLEAYLQGFAGGAGFSGGGLVKQSDFAEMRKAAAAMRTEQETEMLYGALAKKAELRKLKEKTNDPDLLDTYNAQIKELDGVIRSGVVHGNSFVKKMDDSQMKKAAKLAEREEAARDRWGNIQNKFAAGEITLDEKNAAAQAFGAEIRSIREAENDMKAQLEEQPNIRDKKGQMTGNGLWNTSVKQNIDKAITTKGAEGAWDVIQDPNFKKFIESKVGAVWNKMPTDIQATTTFDDVVNEVMMGGTVPPSQTVLGTFKAFKPGKAAPSSYLLGNIDNKITGAISALTQQGKEGRASGQGIVVEGAQEAEGRGPQIADESEVLAPESTRRRTAVEQAQRLGVGPTFTNEIKGKMETLVADRVLNPSDKKFESKYVSRFRDQLAKPIRAAMGKKQNYEQWVQDHAQELLDIYSPRTLAKKRNDPAFAWIENPPTPQEFIDYHLPVREDGKPHPDRAKRQTRLAEAIAEGIGFRAMEDTLAEQQESTTRGAINEGFDKVIEKLRQLQGERGTLQSNPLAIAPAALEGAVRATKAAFNAGMDMGNAIAKGYEKIADQIDFDKYKKWVEDQIKALKSPTSWAEMNQEAVQREIKLAAAEVARAVNPESAWDGQLAEETHYDQFTPSEDPTYMDLVGGTAQWKKFLADNGIEQMVGPKNDLEAYRNFVTETLTKYFPVEFFNSNNNFTVGYKDDSKLESAIGRGVPYTNESVNQMIAENEGKFTYRDDFGVKADFAAFKKVSFNSSNVFSVFQRGEIKRQQENNMNCLEYFGKAIEQIIKDNPENAKFIPGLLQQFSNNQQGLIRASAPVKGASINFEEGHGGKFEVEEHTMPQNLVGRYLLASALEGKVSENFPNIRRNYFQVLLSKADDDKLKGTNSKGEKWDYVAKMPVGWRMTDNVWARYFNDNVVENGGINPNGIYLFDEGQTVAQKYGADITADVSNAPWAVKYRENLNNVIKKIKNGKKLGKGDLTHIPDAVIKAQNLVVNEKVQDNVEQTIDKIIGAIEKLTGPKGALQANIAAVPLHVLVGGLRAAKLAYRGARNLAEAVEAGYQAVKDYMTREEWADFTGKAIQEVKNKESGRTEGLRWASENAIELERNNQLNNTFNKIIEQKSKGRIKADKVFDKGDIGKPPKLGAIRKFFNHPAAEDLKGLLYTVLPSGKEGDAAMKFFEETLLRPYQRGVTQMNAYKANLHDGFKMASKLAGVKKLNGTVPGTNHSWNNAARVALANRNGQEITGIDPTTAQDLIAAVEADPKMSAYVDKINDLFDGNFEWNAKDINRPLGGEIAGVADKVKRKEFIGDYLNNVEQIFNDSNLNKIESLAGKEVRDNLEKTLQRMKSGKNRAPSTDASTSKFMDWMNNATAMIMFANMRSAGLQLLSAANYFNTGGNNIFKAAKNFAKNKQYRNDLATLWNSDYARGRRKGLGFDISSQEIADAATSRTAWNAMLEKVREAGFLPTKIMDSVGTTITGALYYRSRLDKYKQEGHPNPEQEAMEDWVALTEENQQSADPSKISQIQAGPLGRVIFAFGNTPFQYARIMKRAIQDLAAGRGNAYSHVKQILWYGGLQSVIFSTLQQALWMGEDEEEKDKRAESAAMSTIVSWFKSLGLGGAFASTAMALLYETQKEGRKDYMRAAASISPPISKKLSQAAQMANAVAKEDYVKAGAIGAELGANIPAHRVMTKADNIGDIISDDLSATEAFMKFWGWSDYSLGRQDDEETTRRRTRRARPRRQRERRERESRRRSALRRWSEEDSPFKFLGSFAKTALRGANALKNRGGFKASGGELAKGNLSKGIGVSSFGDRKRRAFSGQDKQQAVQNAFSGGIAGLAKAAMTKGKPMMGGRRRGGGALFGNFRKGNAALASGTANASLTPQNDAANAAQEAAKQQQEAQMQQQQELQGQIEQLGQKVDQNQQAMDAQAKTAQDAQEQISQQFEQASEQLTGISDQFSTASEGIGQMSVEESPLNRGITINETPMDNGELGQAHKDGTIDIDPNLKGEKREQVIAHEAKHVEDMQNNGLDYDDNAIYYKGQTFERKDGKIKNEKGEWVEEGDPNLPWEKVAYDAEEEKKQEQKSPMKSKGPGDKKKKPKKEVTHQVYAPGYTKHFGGKPGSEHAQYHKGLGGSEGGQGGLLYSQHRKAPGKMGGTTYTAGIMQNSYGDPIVAGTVGRDWDLGKGWKAGVHGGVTHGYQKSYQEQQARAEADGRSFRVNPDGTPNKLNQFMQDSPIHPVVTGQVEKQFGDSGFGVRAIVNPMYVNAGLTYQFGKKKKKSKKRKK